MELVYFLIETIVKVVAVFAVLMAAVAYLTLAERKILGHIQVRYGPNRVGPFGLFQPIADGIKAFFKEDVVPARADKTLFVIAPMISITAAISLFAVIPFGEYIELLGRRISLTIANLDEVTLVIYIPENRIGQVRLGQEAQVQVDSFPERVFVGHVSSIAGEAEFTPRNVQTQEERVNLVFAVKVRIPNPDYALKPGMPADATIHLPVSVAE